MRRWKVVLSLVGVAVLGVGAAGGWVYFTNFHGTKAIVGGERLGPLVTVDEGYVASFIIDGGEVAGLVDCGLDPAASKIVPALKNAGFEPADVQAIFVTHGHADHIVGCQRFTNATVYALAGDEALYAEIDPPLADYTILADGDRVAVGEVQVTAYHVPGHTQGSASFLVDRVLVMGDNAMAHDDGSLAPTPPFFSDDPERNLTSLRRLEHELGAGSVEHMAFSHTGSLAGVDALRALVSEDGG